MVRRARRNRMIGGSMSEEDLELLVTIDDPGEDTLEEDTFHLQADNTIGKLNQ